MSSNNKTNVIDYPLPSVSGALYADVASDGSVNYEWRKPSVSAETCSIAVTSGATTSDPATVHITTTAAAATIYYTLDGSTPTSSSSVYTSAFTVPTSCTVSAIASYLVGTTQTTTATATASVTIQIPVLSFNYYKDIATVPMARTTDGGYHWNQLPVPPIAGAVGFYNTVYGRVSYGLGTLGVANTDCLLFLTNDHGNTWRTFNSRISFLNGTSQLYASAFYIADHDMLGGVFIVVGYSAHIPIGSNVGCQMCVWYSLDGINYNQATILNLPSSAYCYASRNQNYPQTRAIAYKDGVWIIPVATGYLRSTDPSVWTYYAYPVTTSAGLTDTLATPWGFVIQTIDFLFYSTDAGVTFSYKSIHSYTSRICVMKHSGKVFVMANSNNSVYSTLDGITWTLGTVLLSYVNYLYDCASTADKDILLIEYFSGGSDGHKLAPIEIYDKATYKRNVTFIPFSYSGSAYYYGYGPVSLVWAGANLLAVSPLSLTACVSTDALYWDDVIPNTSIDTILVTEDRSTVPAAVAPAPIPTPLTSAVSGSYNCTTAGPSGTYSVTIGLGGYVILYTTDGSDPNVSQASLITAGNTVTAVGGGTVLALTAGTTTRIRAIAVCFDGRRSTTPLDITITAIQI